MNVRLALLTAALVAASASSAIAQGPPPGGQGGPGGGFGQRRMQMLLTGITLTPAQQAQFDSIQTAFRARMPAFTPGEMPTPEAMQARRALMASQDSSLRTVLTPEQQAVWDRNLEQARSMQRRPPGD
jgi:Spy/CpxP family protein refolding chaperone